MSFKDLEDNWRVGWRRQQYKFEIIHRKGLVNKNADGLVRRYCELFSCEYCAKVE